MTEHFEKKLFLLDAYALIYRAYFAFSKNPRVNSKGFNTSAIFGFTNSLTDIIKNEKPSHIAVVFDTDGPTERHVNFTDYKANRDAQPEDISLSIPIIKNIVEGFRIPVLFSEGYEADDVIGTLAKKAEKEGFKVFMVTPDKDYGQLVSENIFMYKPARMGNGVEILGIEEVKIKFEVDSPLQVIDLLGLMGDSVDNIPGIPGVGPKTAVQLLKEYGSVENIIANADQLKGKLKDKVKENVDKAILSKQLATIILDAPVDFNEESLVLEEPNTEALMPIFSELEFRTLSKRILGEEITATATISPKKISNQFDLFNQEEDVKKEEVELKPISETKSDFEVHDQFEKFDSSNVKYEMVESDSQIKELVLKLSKTEKYLCFDTETTGIDPIYADLVGVSFSIKEKEAFYIPISKDKDVALKQVELLKPLFEDEKCIKVGQNLKYDIIILQKYGVDVKGQLFDTMLAHYLIQPDMRHNMDLLSQTYLNYDPISIEELIGKKGKNQGNMGDLEPSDIKDYACEDADITIRLAYKFNEMLGEEKIRKLFFEVESPLLKVLADMEITGIRLDKSVLKEQSIALEKDIETFEKDIYETAGQKFNIASPKQVGEILFEKLKIIEKPKKTKTGQYATGEDILQKLAFKHEIVDKILTYRELQKLKSTYVDALPELINPETGRIHTSYNQAVAATGRLSSNNPNLQNIPIRTERGKSIRKAFIPKNEDYILLAADYSQIELRIIASLSKDAGMIEAFKNGQDIHASTAAKIYGIELAEVTKEMRRNAKMVNFGIIYGISAFGLSERLNIPRKEAADIISQYFEKFPGIKKYMEDVVIQAKEKKYVETLFGRKRYLPDIDSRNAVVRGFAERNAINAPIQGTAADMIKMAMVELHKKMTAEKFESKMILQVHDELVFDVKKTEKAKLEKLVKETMQNAVQLDVPVIVEIGEGENWLEAH
jgi:DNA polymerase I